MVKIKNKPLRSQLDLTKQALNKRRSSTPISNETANKHTKIKCFKQIELSKPREISKGK